MNYRTIRDCLDGIGAIFSTTRPTGWAEYLEACISKIEIDCLFTGHQKDDVLTQEALTDWRRLFKKRWIRIENTTFSYPYNTTLYTNRIFVSLADLFQDALQSSRFQLLMPTLLSSVSQITANDLMDQGMAVTDLVLGDNNESFISVLDCLSGASEDGILKHTQLLEGTKSKPLSVVEHQRVIEHSEETESFYAAIQERYLFKRDGTTLGALLQLLIDSLRKGGGHQKGDEMNAGEDANLAILNFYRIYTKLSPEIKTKLNDLKGNYNHSFKYYWDILTMNQENKIKEIHENATLSEEERKQQLADVHASVATCVEITAGGLETILNNHQLWLYDQSIDDEILQDTGIISLNEAVKNAEEKLILKLKNIANGENYIANWLAKNECYEFDEAENQLVINLIACLNCMDDNMFMRVMSLALSNTLNFNIIEKILAGLEKQRQIHCLRILKPLLDGYRIVHISAKTHHSVFLAANGKVYDWGNPDYVTIKMDKGQINEHELLFQTEPDFSQVKVVKVVAGKFHTLVITDNGVVYGCGSNSENQLGLGFEIDEQRLLVKLPISDINLLPAESCDLPFISIDDEESAAGKMNIIQIAEGQDHKLMLTSDGKVYGYGNNCHGQLGYSDNIGNYYVHLFTQRLIYCDPSILNLMDQAEHLLAPSIEVTSLPSQSGLFSTTWAPLGGDHNHPLLNPPRTG